MTTSTIERQRMLLRAFVAGLSAAQSQGEDPVAPGSTSLPDLFSSSTDVGAGLDNDCPSAASSCRCSLPSLGMASSSSLASSPSLPLHGGENIQSRLTEALSRPLFLRTHDELSSAPAVLLENVRSSFGMLLKARLRQRLRKMAALAALKDKIKARQQQAGDTENEVRALKLLLTQSGNAMLQLSCAATVFYALAPSSSVEKSGSCEVLSPKQKTTMTRLHLPLVIEVALDVTALGGGGPGPVSVNLRAPGVVSGCFAPSPGGEDSLLRNVEVLIDSEALLASMWDGCRTAAESMVLVARLHPVRLSNSPLSADSQPLKKVEGGGSQVEGDTGSSTLMPPPPPRKRVHCRESGGESQLVGRKKRCAAHAA